MQNYLGDNLDVLTGGLVTGISGLMSGGSGNVVVGQALSGGLISGGPGIGPDVKSTDLVFASFNQDTTLVKLLYHKRNKNELKPLYYIPNKLFYNSINFVDIICKCISGPLP